MCCSIFFKHTDTKHLNVSVSNTLWTVLQHPQNSTWRWVKKEQTADSRMKNKQTGLNMSLITFCCFFAKTGLERMTVLQEVSSWLMSELVIHIKTLLHARCLIDLADYSVTGWSTVEIQKQIMQIHWLRSLQMTDEAPRRLFQMMLISHTCFMSRMGAKYEEWSTSIIYH